MARPTKYKQEYADQARRACKFMGATDEELAGFFEVSVASISNWKINHPEFLEALKAKESADARVIEGLYRRAIGYYHDDIDIRVVNGEIVQTPIVKRYPPDTTAGIFWLKNRQKSKWRDKPEETGDNNLAGAIEKLIDKLPS